MPARIALRLLLAAGLLAACGTPTAAPAAGGAVRLILGAYTTPREAYGELLPIFAQFQRPELQARLRWEKNTVTVWDNRATVHYATADYDFQHRLLHRVTFGADRAF